MHPYEYLSAISKNAVPLRRQRASTGGPNESLTGLHDWPETGRIFLPSPDILFLNHYHSVHATPQEGILVAAQLVEKVAYVDMKALEEEAAVSC